METALTAFQPRQYPSSYDSPLCMPHVFIACFVLPLSKVQLCKLVIESQLFNNVRWDIPASLGGHGVPWKDLNVEV